jgi:hypothetical protein
MRLAFQSCRTPFRKDNWTPRAIEVFATAKAIAAPGLITAQHLALAMEASDTVASRVFEKLGLIPSAALGRSAPNQLCPDGELFMQDFDGTLGRDLQALIVKEARTRDWSYLGTDGLLLTLATIGVPGMQLSYERVNEIINNCR